MDAKRVTCKNIHANASETSEGSQTMPSSSSSSFSPRCGDVVSPCETIHRLTRLDPAKSNQPFTFSNAPFSCERGAARCMCLSSLFPSPRLRETILSIRSKRSNLRAQAAFPILTRAAISPLRLQHSQNIRAFYGHRYRAHFFYPSGRQPRVLRVYAQYALIRVSLARCDNQCRCAAEYVWAYDCRRQTTDG